MASVWPTTVLYYQSKGLRGSQIGILSAVSTLFSLGAAPLWTGLADSRNRHRLVFVVTGLSTACSYLLMSRAGGFWPLLCFATAAAVFSAALGPLMDNATVAMLGERADRYGRIRLWGSAGWGVAAPIAGAFIQAHGLPRAFWIGALGLLACVAASLRVPFTGRGRQEPYWRGARRLLADRSWWFFLCVLFIAGLGVAAYNTYLYAYLDSLGASRGFMGISQTVATVSEIPFFFFAGLLLQRVHARGLLLISLVAIGTRCLLYWIVKVPWAVLPVQLMNGVCFSLFWSAGVAFAVQRAPAGLGATAQGMFGAIIFGFSSAAGGLLGGILLGAVGASAMYGVFGLITFAGLVPFLLGWRLLGGPGLYSDAPRATSGLRARRTGVFHRPEK